MGSACGSGTPVPVDRLVEHEDVLEHDSRCIDCEVPSPRPGPHAYRVEQLDLDLARLDALAGTRNSHGFPRVVEVGKWSCDCCHVLGLLHRYYATGDGLKRDPTE